MKRNRRGFVLVELLAAVAVLIVTFSITSVNAGEINKQLNQSKAVSTARDIFIEAQYNLTALKASGKLELLNDNDGPLSQVVENSDLSFITSQNDNKKNFINDEEYGGSYIIEFDPTTGMVAGVWWASKEDLNGFNQMLTPDKKYKELDEASNTELLEFAEKNKYNIYHYTNDVSAVIASSGPGEIKKQDPQKEPETPISTGFCYYEVYEDNSIGTYIFSTNEDSLKYTTGTIVVGDGYGVILKEKDDPSKVSVSGTKSLPSLKGCQTLSTDGGYIYMFPADWMNANWQDEYKLVKGSYESYNNKEYWWDITINYSGIKDTESWYYSPHYAKSAVLKAEVSSNKDLPATVYIRSARHLNALSWMYSAYFNQTWYFGWDYKKVTGVTFFQELDLDYSKYQFVTYTGKRFAGQKPIGSDWGRFTSTYDGNNKTIYNVKLVSRNKTKSEFTYAGLFGFVSGFYDTNKGEMKCGIVKNVNVSCTSTSTIAQKYKSNGEEQYVPINTIDNADYCGVLVAYVENGVITNCHVNNYVINIKLSSPVTTGDIEYQNARIGCFVGYVKCIQRNEYENKDNRIQKIYTLIDGCSARNCTIQKSSNVSLNTDSYSRHFQIGGFVGGIACNEPTSDRLLRITIKNNYVQCHIDLTTYAQGANLCYIGQFGGAIKKSINISNNSYDVTDVKPGNHMKNYAGV